MSDPRPFSHWDKAIEPRDVNKPHSAQADMLPPYFQFSQNNLQDYMDCARRFQLRYAIGQRWPAPESEPLEEHEQFIERGSQFHMLVQRHLMGVPTEKLTPADPDLRRWWESYLKIPPPDLPTGSRLPELQLSTVIGGQRLMARFDMLAIDPGHRIVIVDWKTTRHRPKRATLSSRMQTRIYPFVLAETGEKLFGGPLKPEQVSLVYWFAETPTEPEVFNYSSSEHQSTHDMVAGLVGEIINRKQVMWPLTDDLNACRFCSYRSLCNRDVEPGDFRDADVEIDIDEFTIDLDTIDEIAF
jgi:hypothetical protein